MRRVHLVLLALAALAGCAIFGHGRPEGSNPENEHWLHRIMVHTIQARRPEGTPFDPKAYPWDAAFRSKPLPDSRFNCAPLPTLTQGLDLAQVRACLKSIQRGDSVLYKLVRGPRPELVLEGMPVPVAQPAPSASPAPSDSPTPSGSPKPLPSPTPPPVPPCLVKVLPRIPVPREIVYQSAEEGRPTCYSSRLEDSTGLGADLVDAFSTNRLGVRVSFPISPELSSDLNTAQWIHAVALAPFLREQGILGRLLVDAECRACLGEATFVKAWEPTPLTWPLGEGLAGANAELE